MGTKSQIQKIEEPTLAWIDEKRVAQITGLAVQTLRNHRFKRIGFPYYKRGRSVRYKIADVLSGMEAGRIDPLK